MDDGWVKVQHKAFGRWVSMHLAKKNIEAVTQLDQDLQDGLKLIALLEILSAEPFPHKYNKKARMRIQKMENLGVALKFISDSGVKLTNIGAGDIVDGNLKLVLGLIWTIIQKFVIADISLEELTAKEALLLWCQRKTEPYEKVNIKEFKASWSDGLGFLGLIHRHRPDLVPNPDTLDKNDHAGNLELAFSVAQEKLGIHRLLDVEDMEVPDERSVITYVSEYYRVFSSNQKQEIAGRRVGKLIALTKALNKMKEDYNRDSSALADWIEKKTNELNTIEFDNTLAGAEEKRGEYKTYQTDERPPKAAEKAAVTQDFKNLQLKLKSNHRPEFVPEISPEDLDNKWNGLEDSEKAYQERLRAELERQRKIASLLAQFRPKYDNLVDYSNREKAYFETEEEIDTLPQAQGALKALDQHDKELATSNNRVKQLNDLGEKILALEAKESDEVKTKMGDVADRWSGLESSSAEKRKRLLAALEREQEKERLRKLFADLVNAYCGWVDLNKENVANSDFGNDLESVRAYKGTMDSENEGLNNDSSSKVGEIQGVWDQLQALGVKDNRYTPLVMDDVNKRQDDLGDAINKRSDDYAAELARQEEMEAKRIEFADAAKAFDQFLKDDRVAVDAIGGEPQAVLDQLRDHHKDGEAGNNHLATCQRIDAEAKALGITSNRHTDLTVPVLATRNGRHNNYVDNFSTEMEEEIALKEDFDNHAKALYDWILATIPELQNLTFDNTLEGIRALFAQFENFGKKDLAEKKSEKSFVEKKDAAIKARLAASKHERPAFNPPITVEQLNEEWEKLQAAVKARREGLTTELKRQENLFNLVNRFNADADRIESWQQEKDAYLQTDEEVNTIIVARVLVKALDSYDKEYDAFQAKMAALKELCGEITGDNYVDSQTVQDRLAALEGTNAGLVDKSAEKRNRLNAHLERFEQKCKEFGEKAQAHLAFLEKIRADINALEGEPQELTEKINSTYQDGQEAKDSLAAMQALDDELVLQMNITENEHTTASMADLKAANRALDAYVQDYKLALQDEQTLKDEYNRRADALLAWISKTKPVLEDHSNENTLADARAKVSAHNNYVKGERAEQDAALGVIGEVVRKIEKKLESHSFGAARPAFAPEHPLDELKSAWADLTAVEKAREEALNAELQRQEDLDKVLKSFNLQDADLNTWISAKQAYLEAVEDSQSLSSAEIQQTILNGFEEEYEAKKENVKTLGGLAGELVAGNHVDKESVQAKSDATEAAFNGLSAGLAAKRERSGADESRESKKEELRIAFADGAKDYAAWTRDTNSTLQERTFGNDLESVTAYQATLDSSNADTNSQNDEKHGALAALSAQLTEAGVDQNRHTSLTQENVGSFHASVQDSISKRNDAYGEALAEQQNIEAHRKEFAEAANKFHSDTTAKIAEMQEASKSNPEDPSACAEAVAAVHNGYDAQAGYDAAIEVEGRGRAIGMVGHNAYTEQNGSTLKKTLTLFQNTANSLLSSLKDAASLKERKEAADKEWEERERVEALAAQYTEKAQHLNLWLEDTNDRCTADASVGSIDEAQAQLEEHQGFAKSAADQDAVVAELQDLSGQINEGNGSLRSSAPPDEFSTKVEEAKQALANREEQLNNELTKQKEHEAIRQERASVIGGLTAFLSETEKSVGDVDGSLEDQVAGLNKLSDSLQTDGKQQLEAVQAAQSNVDSNQVDVNDPEATIQLRTRFNDLETAISSKRKVVEEEILAKKGTTLSAEQLAEYRSTFDFFDKDKKGTLGAVLLKGVLSTLGEDPTDDDVTNILAKYDKSEDGELDFNEFVQFMSSHAADTDTADQLVDALKVLAGDKDYVTLADLATGLSPEEVEYLQGEIPPFEGVEGGLDYKAWVSKVYNQ